MSNLAYNILTTIFCSMTLAGVFYFLYRSEKKEYLFVWGWSYFLFSLSFANALTTELYEPVDFVRNISLGLEVGSGILMMSGANRFVHKMALSRSVHAAITVFFIFLILLMPLESHLPEIIAVHIFVGFAQIMAGLLLLKNIVGAGGRIAGVSLFLWGIHRLDFILTLFYPSISAINYHLTILLIMTTTFGIMLMHFERIKTELNNINSIFVHAAEYNKNMAFKLLIRPSLRLEFVSPSVVTILGYSPEELTESDKFYADILDQEQIYQIIKNSEMNGLISNAKYYVTSKYGRQVILNVNAMVVLGTDGKPDYILGMTSDVTESSKAMELLTDRKQWYEEIFNKSRMMIMLINCESMAIADCNASVAAYYCMDGEKMKGELFESFFYDKEEYIKYLESAVSGYEFDARHLLPDGSTMQVTIFTTRITLNDTSYYYVTIFDNNASLVLAEELKRAVSLHRHLLESMNEGTIGISKNGDVFFINDCALAMLGYEQSELLYANLHDVIHRGLCGDQCNVNDALTLGENLKEVTDVFIKKDGSHVTVKYNFSYLKESANAGILVFRDITEDLKKERTLKKAFENNLLLMHELHHRVKNNFQIISSLLALHADCLHSGDEKVFLMESISKIHSLAMIHENLYQNESLAHIDAGEYFRGLMNSLADAFCSDNRKTVVSVDIEKMKIHIDEVVPCALIINELFTNSVKYARINGENLEIKFSLRDENGFRYLVFSDNGHGSTETSTSRSSYGLKIIASLARQLKAEIKVDMENGFRTELKYITLTAEK